MFICTPDNLWKPENGTPVQHSGAEENGEQRDGYPGGDIQPMKCRDCGATWREELPQ